MKFSEMMKVEGSLEEMMNSVKNGGSVKGGGRKEEVFNILKGGIYSVKELSKRVGVSGRNISSVICYLRDDGMDIRKVGMGGENKLVLWSKIVNGEKVGNRVEIGKKGKVIRYNFEKECFEDEVVVEKEVKKK